MFLRQSRFGPFYGCEHYPRCRSTHGAHPNGMPLGTPADVETKAARMVAHTAFDPLWRDALELYPNIPERPRRARQDAIYKVRARARVRAYAWLAEQLAIPAEECHIGLFDSETCRRVIKAAMNASAKVVRDWAKERNL
jgi:ssDNA-binding Zn-finger/Zn-ribbon topoisomerase 1